MQRKFKHWWTLLKCVATCVHTQSSLSSVHQHHFNHYLNWCSVSVIFLSIRKDRACFQKHVGNKPLKNSSAKSCWQKWYQPTWANWNPGTLAIILKLPVTCCCLFTCTFLWQICIHSILFFHLLWHEIFPLQKSYMQATSCFFKWKTSVIYNCGISVYLFIQSRNCAEQKVCNREGFARNLVLKRRQLFFSTLFFSGKIFDNQKITSCTNILQKSRPYCPHQPNLDPLIPLWGWVTFDAFDGNCLF